MLLTILLKLLTILTHSQFDLRVTIVYQLLLLTTISSDTIQYHLILSNISYCISLVSSTKFLRFLLVQVLEQELCRAVLAVERAKATKKPGPRTSPSRGPGSGQSWFMKALSHVAYGHIYSHIDRQIRLEQIRLDQIGQIDRYRQVDVDRYIYIWGWVKTYQRGMSIH